MYHSFQQLRQRAPLFFLFVSVFVDMLGYGIVIPLLPFYVQQQQAGGAVVGLLGSLYALLQFGAGPLLGSLSDRYGRRPLLLICLSGTALAYLLLGLADTLWLLVFAVFLDGITGGNLALAQAYIADSTTPQQRARSMGLVGAAFGLGLMLGPALGGLLSVYSLQTPALVAAAVATLNVVFGLLALPESLPPERRNASPTALLNPLAPLVAGLHLRAIRPLLLTILLLNLAFAGLQNNFPLFSAARFGWDAASNGLFYAFVGLCAVVTQGFVLGKVQPRYGDANLTLLGLTLMTINLALMALVPVDWLLYPVVGMLALGSGLCIPALTSLVSGQAQAHEQGRAMGSMQSVLSLAMIAGPTMAGLAFDYIGATAPYWLGSLLALLALALAASTLSVLSPAAARHEPADIS